MPYGLGRRLGLGCLLLCFALAEGAGRADLLQSLGLRKRGLAGLSLSDDQIAGGLKEALEVGVKRAVETLGRADGFLKDRDVRIPLPAGLRKAESALRGLGQDRLADEFVASMNRAAEKAVPEAAAVLVDSVKQMTLDDARAILTSTNTAATDFFRRTSSTNLHARLLPIVKQSTASAGVTAKYKEMLERSGANRGGLLGGLSRSLLGTETLDLDDYVTGKTLDGLFVKIAEEEVRIRENPTARTTEILEQVFGRSRK